LVAFFFLFWSLLDHHRQKEDTSSPALSGRLQDTFANTIGGKIRLYYINPFNYLIGALLVFTTWETPVSCSTSELAIFDPPSLQTCLEYLSPYLQSGNGAAANLLNPQATANCKVCQYKTGADYLRTLNIKDKSYGWRDAGIVCVFVVSGYGLVFLLMKLRTKKSKKAE
jgi:ABC-type multidrug transport system permease subunit